MVRTSCRLRLAQADSKFCGFVVKEMVSNAQGLRRLDRDEHHRADYPTQVRRGFPGSARTQAMI